MSDSMPGIADLRTIRHRTERIAELEAVIRELRAINVELGISLGKAQEWKRERDVALKALAEERARLRRAITLLLETHKHPGSVRAWKAAGKFLRNHPLAALPEPQPIRPAGISSAQDSARNIGSSRKQIAETPANIGDGDGGAIKIKYTTPPEPIETTVKREGL